MSEPGKKDPVPTRKAYGDALVELGERHEEIVALDADLAVSTQSMQFG
jgi:transketolase